MLKGEIHRKYNYDIFISYFMHYVKDTPNKCYETDLPRN